MKKKKELDETKLDSIAEGLKKLLTEEEALPPMWFLHSGNLALDYIISGLVNKKGGYVCGTTEIFGDPSTGKSLLLAKAIAEMQKLGEITVLADSEMRWDDSWAEKQGVDPKKLLRFFPETVEDFAIETNKLLDKLIEDNKKALIVLDSLAILSTIKETDDVDEGEMKADQGRKAQRIKMAMRVIKGKIRKSGSILLISNHVIANPGSYGNQKMVPGGQGVPFQSNVRIELTKPTPLTITGRDRPIGVELHIYIPKNSVSPPFGSCDIQLYWSTGVSLHSGLLDLALDLGIITRKGAWNYYKDISFQSINFGDILSTNPEILEDAKWKHNYFMGE